MATLGLALGVEGLRSCVFSASMLESGSSAGQGAPMMWHRSWGAGDWLVMSLMMLIFWGALVAGAVWLVRNARRPGHSTGSARQILDEKLAHGEVTEEEYLRRRELLTR